MHMTVWFLGGLAGAFVGWVLALVLSRLVPEPPHARPTAIGWVTLVLAVAALVAGGYAWVVGRLSGPLVIDTPTPEQLGADPVAWLAALAAASLFTGFMGAGRVADRHWPTGVGLVVSLGVVLGGLVLMLSGLGGLLLSRQ